MIKLSKEGLLIGDTLFTDQKLPSGSIYLDSFNITGQVLFLIMIQVKHI